MTKLIIKTEPQILERFKAVSQELYHGDDAAAFYDAVLALISLREKRDTTRLEAIINKIRADIKSCGGLTAKQIDQLVRESRQRRKFAQAVMSLEDVKVAINKLDKQSQQKLLQDLPKLLGISSDAAGWLKAAASSFEFWDNKEDAVYDRL